MQGLTFATLKKYSALFPVFLCIGTGGLGALFYSIRVATRSPDVSWFNKKEAEPWNAYKDKQYKFYVSKEEYGKMKSPAPEY